MNSVLMTSARPRVACQLRQYVPDDESSELYPDDTAYRAVMDFQRDRPITVPVDYPVAAASGDMQRLGIHALLVTREDPDGGAAQLVGLVTRRELQHPRAREEGFPCAPGAAPLMRVADVMTPVGELSVVRYASLRGLTVGDVHELFQGSGLTHLVVVDGDGNDLGIARGLISRARLAGRLRAAP